MGFPQAVLRAALRALCTLTHGPTEAFLTATTAAQKLPTGAQRDTDIPAATSQTPKGVTATHPAATHASGSSSLLPCTRGSQTGS